jgi:hypothetical protein
MEDAMGTNRRIHIEPGPIDPKVAEHAQTILALVKEGAEAGETIEAIARSERMRQVVEQLRRDMGDDESIDAEKVVLAIVSMLVTFSPAIDATKPPRRRLGSVGKRPRRNRPSR